MVRIYSSVPAILVACLVAIYGWRCVRACQRSRDGDMRCRATTGGDYSAGDRGGSVQAVLWIPALARRGEALTGMGLPIAVTCLCWRGSAYHSGSATVACLTAVGLVMPVIEQLNYSGAQMAALSICIAGSIVVSHVNDAGFWLFGNLPAQPKRKP
ncbi:MAG: hypothetical protein ACLTXH_03240 [Enterobacter hormaechei]